jgi:hypothetical protein
MGLLERRKIVVVNALSDSVLEAHNRLDPIKWIIDMANHVIITRYDSPIYSTEELMEISQHHNVQLIKDPQEAVSTVIKNYGNRDYIICFFVFGHSDSFFNGALDRLL